MAISGLIKDSQYEKISDDLYWFGSNTILRFNVTLAKRMEDGRRKQYYQEYGYNSNKYIDKDELVTIRRQFDYFLTIENIKEYDNMVKEYIMIGLQDFIFFKEKIEDSSKWFSNNKLYSIKDNKLIMIGKVDTIEINLIAMNKKISLEPILMKFETNNIAGIRMTIGGNKDNYVDISVDKYMGFVYLITSFNMYQSAQLLLNYMHRPDNGSNLMTFDTVFEYEDKSKVKGITGRLIGSNRNDINKL